MLRTAEKDGHVIELRAFCNVCILYFIIYISYIIYYICKPVEGFADPQI